VPDEGVAALRPIEREQRELEQEESVLLGQARRALGMAQRREKVAYGAARTATGEGWRVPLLLWALALADAAAGAAVMLCVPFAQLSVGPGALGQETFLRPLLFALGGASAVTVLDRAPAARAVLARGAAAVSGLALAVTALSTANLALSIGVMVVSAASGALTATVLPLLFDVHRPELRGRAVGGYVAAVASGIGVSALVMTVVTGAGLTWRVGLLVLSVLPLAAGLAAIGLPVGPVGAHDERRIRLLVEQHLGAVSAPSDADAVDATLTTFEKFQRAAAGATSARILILLPLVFGVVVWGLDAPLTEFLRDRWLLLGGTPMLVFGLLALVGVPAALWYSQRAETAYRARPMSLVDAGTWGSLAVAASLILAVTLPVFGLTILFLAVTFAAGACILVAAVLGLLSVTAPSLRGHAAVLLGTVALLGATVAPQDFNSFAARFGVEWGLIILATVPLAIRGARQGRRARPNADADVDNVARKLLETHELAVRTSLGHHLPLLSCRRIDFSYGQVQVLFGVSLTVDDGEMVALLGTNGAGKSTLLRVVSGLGFPSAGSVNFRGADITYLGADRRVELGISQVPGGRAVFGPMSVVDNLRAYGHTHRRNRAELERLINDVFVTLPRLGERSNQLASTLSGGEQQMLALGKALILKPRLLCIDELSLGLAPIIVGELLKMVNRINAAGAAVILVEQSVNVALSMTDHAYFMEKGEVRFDGTAATLLDRSDLLRSVFLQGATDGIMSGTPS
jgi:ABC-type branched-subunit amino acid transport system ATPase component